MTQTRGLRRQPPSIFTWLWRRHAVGIRRTGLAIATAAAIGILAYAGLPLVLVNLPAVTTTAAAARPQLPPPGPAEPTNSVSAESPFAALLAPAPTATPRPTSYDITAGDTLVDIANRFGLRPETLVWANQIANADLILAGEKLRVPPADGLFVEIQAGESLADLVDRYSIDAAEVLRVNKLDNADRLVAGVELFLPGARRIAPIQGTGDGGQGDLERVELTEEMLAAAAAPWLSPQDEVALYAGPEQSSRVITKLPKGTQLERNGALTGARVPVLAPGDGQSRLAFQGWVDVRSVTPGRGLHGRELPTSYPDNTRMDVVQVLAPYRTQLDGTAWAGANCGPTSLSMALAALGIDASPGKLRPQVLNAQRLWGNDVGTLITALAQVGESYGATAVGLYEGDQIHRWTLDEIRQQLNLRRPVIVQVRYRALPGREGYSYAGDHYIVLTAALDDGFLYNDPIDRDGLGWDRIISSKRLYEAMNATDRRYVYAAFALTQ